MDAMTQFQLLIIAAAASLVLYFGYPLVSLARNKLWYGILVGPFMTITGYLIGYSFTVLILNAYRALP